MLFRPYDSEFPIKYDGLRVFEEVKQFLDSFDPVETKKGDRLSLKAIERICKPRVTKAVKLFEKDVKQSGLLITPADLKYYRAIVSGIQRLAQNNKGARSLVLKMQNLRTQAHDADKAELKDFEKFRTNVMKETKEEYVQIAEKIAHKIQDVENIIDSRGLKIRQASHHHTHLKNTKGHQNNKPSKHVHTETIKSNPPPIINSDQDRFKYAYLIKYGLTFLGGMTIVLIFNKISSLDKIVTFIENQKDV